MKYVVSFDASYYNKLDLDAMTDEERWSTAEFCMGIGTDEAQIVALDEWVKLYNNGNVPEGGSLYIYLIDKDEDAFSLNYCGSCGETKEEIDKDEAWHFYDVIAKPQTKLYINDYDGDLSIFWHSEDKTFWYEVWIDLEDNWVNGEKIYLQVKDMDLREVGKYLFNKLCRYEAYYDSQQWIEDLNKMAQCIK